jgi:hypothetical protein
MRVSVHSHEDVPGFALFVVFAVLRAPLKAIMCNISELCQRSTMTKASSGPDLLERKKFLDPDGSRCPESFL